MMNLPSRRFCSMPSGENPMPFAWLRVEASILRKDRRDNLRQPATPGARASVEYSEARRNNTVIPAAVISEMAAVRRASACLC